MFLVNNKVISDFQSVFRKRHSTTTAALKAFNHFIHSIDTKQLCAALFVDLSKAFDLVDHSLLIHSLVRVGLSTETVCWSETYLADRTPCLQVEGYTSERLKVTK